MQATRLIRAVVCTTAVFAAVTLQYAQAQTSVTPGEARAIAKEAYIYANPLVDSYRVLYGYFVDRENPDYKAPWNQIRNISFTSLLFPSLKHALYRCRRPRGVREDGVLPVPRWC